MNVVSPNSPNFGQHWSAKQIAETFSPSPEAADAVRAWLLNADESLSIDSISLSPSRGWLTFNATALQVENLLHTTYYVYQHYSTGAEQIASESYSVPEAVRNHIDFITPTLQFDPRRKTPQSASTRTVTPRTIFDTTARPVSLVKAGPKVLANVKDNNLSTCNSIITPDCVRALYGIPSTPLIAAANSLGVVEYGSSSITQSDLDMFFTNFSSDLVGTSPTIDFIDGGYLTNDSSFESALDLDYAMSLTAPLNLTLFQVGDPVESASFNNFLDAIDGSYCTYDGGDVSGVDSIYPDPSNKTGAYTGPKYCGNYTPPAVITTSYGEDENSVTETYAARQCYEYMKLGLLGVTVLYSSGDSGVAGVTGQCGGTNHGIIEDFFTPSFPGTCPYVTSVGGTQIAPGANVSDPEVAVYSGVYSGGGFSNYFPIPIWQEATLATWWSENSYPYTARQYNNSQKTRGYPDISANAANYIVAAGGQFNLVSGTSAASPVIASLITHVNDALLNAGKSVVGFLNPVLYAHPEVLNDITSGDNPGCGK
jgi:tripeptidyl-peptidase-1